MTYRINVSKDDGPNWDNSGRSFRYYFHIETTLFGDALRDLVDEIRNQWPAPSYKVEVSKHQTYRETVDI
jgi:hypothetical protein